MTDVITAKLPEVKKMESTLPEVCILKIPSFEGPFDLLFHLFEKNKIDIHDIPISLIADQYIQYLDDMAKLDMDIASEFIVMASTLLHIKSRMLLPAEKETGEESEDPREDLVARLFAYKKFKEVALMLKQREELWSGVEYRLPVPTEKTDIPEIILELDKNILQDTAQRIFASYNPSIENTAPKMAVILKKEKHTIRGKINEILLYLGKKIKFIFMDLFRPDISSKEEIVAGFAAILELSRTGKLVIVQNKPFSDIIISRGSRINEYEKYDISD